MKYLFRNEMLTAAFSPRMEEYARRVGRVGQMKLVVFALDSIHIAIHVPSNHDTLKRTFSSKISHNGVVFNVVASPDSMPCWASCLGASVSPANTDERQAWLSMHLNSQGLTGGFLDFLTGPHTTPAPNQVQVLRYDFFVVLLIDKGYRGYGRQPAGP